MAHDNITDAPTGVSIMPSGDSCIRYCGADAALIAAGIIHADWIDGLGRLTRRIVVDSDGRASIVGEGMRGALTHAQREHGVFTAKRLFSGMLEVCKYLTVAEQRAREVARQEEGNREREQEAWVKAKEARGERDFLGEWKNNVISEAGKINRLIEGSLIYTGFPEIKLSHDSMLRVKSAVEELSRAIADARPMSTDLETRCSNVIGIRAQAYRYMA